MAQAPSGGIALRKGTAWPANCLLCRPAAGGAAEQDDPPTKPPQPSIGMGLAPGSLVFSFFVVIL